MSLVIHSIPELQQWSRDAHKAGKTVGLVPTMGFLHDGHLSLIDAARANGADAVVISIFVNPIQFGPNEDFAKYPRDFERDRALCEAKGVDVIFAPGVEDMYPEPLTCHVYENTISKNLCGKSRPIHFEGEIPLKASFVIPKPFDPRVVPRVARKVAEAAMASGVAQIKIDDLDAYERAVAARIARNNKQ